MALLHQAVGGKVFSVPDVSAEDAAKARVGSVTDALAILDEASAGRQLYFQSVMQGDVNKKKAIRSLATKRSLAAMSVPIMQQRYEAWPSEQGVVQVFPVGVPDLADLLRAAEWPTIRSSVRSWEIAPTEVPGCIQLVNPIKVSQTWSLRHSETPTLVILEHLALLGWQHCGRHALKEHARDGPRQFSSTKNPIADKPYLQCLANLEQLLSVAFAALPIGQHMLYYKLVLSADAPEAILAGQPAAFYKQALGNAGHADVLLQLEDVALDDGDSDQPMACDEPEQPSRVAQRPPSKRTASQSNPFADALWQPFPSELTLVAQPKLRKGPPRSGPQPMALEGEQQSTPGASSSASMPATAHPQPPGQEAAQPATPQQECAQEDNAVVAPPTKKARKSSSVVATPRAAREIVAAVDGVEVVRDTNGAPGEDGYYTRVGIRCPYHTKCTKHRNCHAAQTAHFGEMEPVAFLLSWMKKGATLPDKATHSKVEAPSVQDLELEMRAQGWIPQ